MKVIDLLNKIANGEEVPKKIRFREDLLFYDEDIDYKDNDGLSLFNDKCCINQEELNEEVEIIEDTPKENKKIEKIDLPIPSLSPQLIFLSTKINEIIDRLNGEDNE